MGLMRTCKNASSLSLVPLTHLSWFSFCSPSLNFSPWEPSAQVSSASEGPMTGFSLGRGTYWWAMCYLMSVWTLIRFLLSGLNNSSISGE